MTWGLPKQRGLHQAPHCSWQPEYRDPASWEPIADHRAKDIRPNLRIHLTKTQRKAHLTKGCTYILTHLSQRDLFAVLILHLGVTEIISCLPSTLLNQCFEQVPCPIPHSPGTHRSKKRISDCNKQVTLTARKSAPEQIHMCGFSGNCPGPLKSVGGW